MKTPIIISVLVGALLLGCQQQIEETQPIRKDITETVFASGELAAEGTYQLTAQTDGYLLAVNFEEGDIVAEGAVLAVIKNETSRLNTQSSRELLSIAEQNTRRNAPALSQARTAIDIARQKLAQDSLQAQRFEKLWRQNSIARVDYENARLAYRNSKSSLESAIETYNKLQVDAEQQLINSRNTYALSASSREEVETRAVVEGKIYAKYKEVGDYVRRGEVIASIGHARNVYARVNVDESAISKVKVGQMAVVQLNTNPDVTYTAEVSRIYPAFDEVEQSFSCKLTFRESLDFQVVGTQLQTNIVVDEVDNALLIPRQFLDYNGYVQVKGAKEKTRVETRTISNEWVHVVDGIDEQTVLTVALD